MERHGAIFHSLVDLFFISSVKAGSLMAFSFFNVSVFMAVASIIRYPLGSGHNFRLACPGEFSAFRNGWLFITNWVTPPLFDRLTVSVP